MDNKKLAEIFYRFLSKKKHIVDGFIFEFNYVKSEDTYFKFGVNVILPTKEWSYFKRDLEQRATDIIGEVTYPIFGNKIAMSLDLTINSLPSLPCYINKQKLNQIYKQINSKFNKFKYGNYTINLSFDFTPKKYGSNFDEIEIPFFVDVNRLQYINKQITFREVYLEDVTAWIWELLNGDPNLSMDVADECFYILNDELKLLEDMLITSNLLLRTVNGFSVDRISDMPPSETDLKKIFIVKNA